MILVTVRPGPTVYVWRDGRLLLKHRLSLHEALTLCSDILKHMRSKND